MSASLQHILLMYWLSLCNNTELKVPTCWCVWVPLGKVSVIQILNISHDSLGYKGFKLEIDRYVFGFFLGTDTDTDY